MTNEEILTKAIQKAIAGGYKVTGLPREFKVELPNVVFNSGNLLLKWEAGNSEHTITLNLYAVIFSHDFLKALWGECTTWVRSAKGTVNHLPLNGWQYHAQQMVINNDQIKYLGANI